MYWGGVKGRPGFTLAEVLVTLAVIGVVASLTIPAMVKNMSNAGTAAKVKKYNSLLNQVIRQYSADKDCVGNLAGCGLYGGGWADPWHALKPYFKFSLECGPHKNTPCFSGIQYKYLNGDPPKGDCNDTFYDCWRSKGILIDGASIMINDDTAGNCSTNKSRTGTTALSKRCGNFIIDINGRKSPNQWGRDMFSWTVTNSGQVIPSGALDHINVTDNNGTPDCDPNDTATAQWNTPGGGFGCAGRIMREGGMDY